MSNTTGLIPDQLLSNLQKGNCVLFLGADLPLPYSGAPLSRPELAAALAEQYDLPRGLSWSETATAYQGRYPKDRHTLIGFLSKHSGSQAGPLHRAIAQAGFRAIVTAWYDEWLERSLQEAGYHVHRVVRDLQAVYSEQGQREVTVVKLFGCLSDIDSLVLDHREHVHLLGHLGQKLVTVQAFTSIRPLLFVGHDLTDDTLLELYTRASEGVVEHMRRAYAAWPTPTEAMRANWVDLNLEFLDCAPTLFLESLAAQLPMASLAGGDALHVKKPPYKFLDYYQSADADLFCGRDVESQLVTRLALTGRLLTLFGPSGAGKTSLLLAGVSPRLAAEGYGQIYLRALDDPLLALRKALSERAGRPDISGGDLRACFESLLGENDRLLVILDQFEELFLHVGSKIRKIFFEQLAAAMTNPSREVRFIVSLREDYLARLDEARPDLPDVLSSSFRLPELDRSHARLAITEPASRAGVTVEPALVDLLVGMTGSEGGDLVDADGLVPPPALQIVLDSLYRETLPKSYDSHEAPPAGLALTLAAYQASASYIGEGESQRELRGAQAILARYLDAGLAKLPILRLPNGSPLGAKSELGRALLKVLVTSRSTKAALTQAELITQLEEVGELAASDEADRARLEATRLGLEQVRLVRAFERDGLSYYELAHDHLALAITAWLSEAELHVKMARELLRRAQDNWRAAKLLIPIEALSLIHARREDLKRLSVEELELLLRSALQHGYEVQDWFRRAQMGGVAADEIALDGLKSRNFQSRAAAAQALGKLGGAFIPALCGALADEYPHVRMAAIQALERLDPTGEWRKHLQYECFVAAGEFVMGDDEGDSDEKPAHKLFLEAYYIGKYPVTNADYGRYKADVKEPFSLQPGKENHPVESVAWYDALNYAAWAGMRLLTEAEWEKAASWQGDGKKRAYPWGDEFDKSKCNTSESGIKTTSPVGKYSPQGDSPSGCADMAGNVWEWMSSLKKDYPYQSEDGREDQVSTGMRVLRGGSWYRGALLARNVSRDEDVPDYRFGPVGFRVGASSRYTLDSELVT